MTRTVFLGVFTGLILCAAPVWTEAPASYAQRLGWGPGDKVVIFHIDDAGMSHGSNLGVAKAMAEGVATSTSIMMPCPWVPQFRDYLKANPDCDAGLHFTLTSEWVPYRWGPVAGKMAVPGLADRDGYLWGEVADVIAHATPQEVETEIRAQWEKAEAMGIKPTHLDSHMGTLFASKPYFERYIQLGIEKGIPVLVAGGHLHFLKQDSPGTTRRAGRHGRKGLGGRTAGAGRHPRIELRLERWQQDGAFHGDSGRNAPGPARNRHTRQRANGGVSRIHGQFRHARGRPQRDDRPEVAGVHYRARHTPDHVARVEGAARAGRGDQVRAPPRPHGHALNAPVVRPWMNGLVA